MASRVYHVALRDAAATEEAKIGAIVEVSRTPSQRPADRNIAIVATGTGVYHPAIIGSCWRSLRPVSAGETMRVSLTPMCAAWRR